MPKFDLIIIGSGLAGLHAASAVLSNKTISVAMLDVGFDESTALESGRGLKFEEHRRYDASQHKIFLGDDLSALKHQDINSGHAGNMTSGRRGYITRSTNEYLPIKSTDAVVLQSLAQGGLSEAWGAVCGFFDKDECGAVGIPFPEIKASYEEVVKRIGVSGFSDDLKLQPPPLIDDNAKSVLSKYNNKKRYFNSLGLDVKQPPLALLTEDFDSRKKTAYRDMDFWDNIGRSIYRGHYTLEKLKGCKNFTYINNCLVNKIEYHKNHVVINSQNIQTGENIHLDAKAVIVAAGALNSTRILLRSFNMFDIKVPILIKSNYILPCILFDRLGKVPDIKKHSLCQLVIHDNQKRDFMMSTYIQLYSYNSLLLHKLLQYVPFLPKPEALSALSLVVPSMMLADIRFPSTTNKNRFAVLKRGLDQKDYLDIYYPHLEEEKEYQYEKIKRLKKALIHLGLLPVSTVSNAYGASAHYAGGIPFSDGPIEGLLSVNKYGGLHNMNRIFIADSATWKALPAKPPGLTIMANANRIGNYVRDLILDSTI